MDRRAVAHSDPPYVVAVTRQVPSHRRAESVMQRLYAGPTQKERRHGLRFIASGTTGFEHVDINDRAAARVVLVGTCRTNASVGKDVTVASQSPAHAVVAPRHRSGEPVCQACVDGISVAPQGRHPGLSDAVAAP